MVIICFTHVIKSITELIKKIGNKRVYRYDQQNSSLGNLPANSYCVRTNAKLLNNNGKLFRHYEGHFNINNNIVEINNRINHTCIDDSFMYGKKSVCVNPTFLLSGPHSQCDGVIYIYDSNNNLLNP